MKKRIRQMVLFGGTIAAIFDHLLVYEVVI
jgi:hypothetical protein